MNPHEQEAARLTKMLSDAIDWKEEAQKAKREDEEENIVAYLNRVASQHEGDAMKLAKMFHPGASIKHNRVCLPHPVATNRNISLSPEEFMRIFWIPGL